MSSDEAFPPVDPIVPTPGPGRVVPRRRHFSQKSRELNNLLNQKRKELKDQMDSVGKTPPLGPGSSQTPPIPPKFDKLA
jgi:hypothetical protein